MMQVNANGSAMPQPAGGSGSGAWKIIVLVLVLVGLLGIAVCGLVGELTAGLKVIGLRHVSQRCDWLVICTVESGAVEASAIHDWR